MSIESRELALYAENNAELYRSRIQPVIKNLALKKVRGTYDTTLALKLWKYVADDAAQRYTKEFGVRGTGSSYGIFTVSDRKQAAADLAESYAEELDGYFSQHPDELPKKYRAKNPVTDVDYNCPTCSGMGRIKTYAASGRSLAVRECKTCHGTGHLSLRDKEKLVARRRNPGSRSIHTKKFDRCVSQVKRRGGGYNSYAVCAASLGERKSIKKKHRRTNPLAGFNLVAKNGARRAYFNGDEFVTSKAEARIFPSVAAVRETAGRLVRGHHLKAGWKLVAAAVVSRNPAARGERLYSDFHGEPPRHVKMHRLPAFREGVEVGPLVAVTYDTVRDGKKIRFEHEFKKRASPLLTVSDDGRKIAVIGGDFRFTDRGFVDQPK